MFENNNTRSPPPPLWKRASALWIDFVLLLGVYMVLGFLSERLYQIDAYPPAAAMQLYGERDFIVYWFFFRWTLLITAVYLFFSYKFIGQTFGQKLVRIKLMHKNGNHLSNSNIFLRVLWVLLTLMFIMLPGPIIAIMFYLIGEAYLNEALSVLLLLVVVFALLYFSVTRYQRGKTRSFKDVLSKTIMLDIANTDK